MKKHARILAGLLSACLLTGCLAACDQNVTIRPNPGTQSETNQDTQVQTQSPNDEETALDTQVHGTTPAETVARGEVQTTAETVGQSTPKPSDTPYVQRNNYNETLTVIYCRDTFEKGYFFTDPDNVNEERALDAEVYERERTVEEYLGVTIEAVNGGPTVNYASVFANSMAAGDDAYQMLMTHTYMGISSIIAPGYLYDMNDMAGSLNLDADYWNAQMMEDLSVHGKKYLAYNDFCLSSYHLVAFNKSMYAPCERYAGNLYETVRKGEWTLDKMVSVASLVEDTRDMEQKCYGLSLFAWAPLISFVTASDIKMIDKDAATGDLYVVSNMGDNQTLFALYQKLYGLCQADYTYAWGFEGGKLPTEALTLGKGRSLMSLCSNFELLNLKGSSVDFGVLPYPKYAKENQSSYKTLSWNGLLGISSAVKNPRMVGDVMEMLAYCSAPVTDAFDEYLLGATAEEKPDDIEMLRLIRKGLVSDLGLVFDDTTAHMDAIVFAIPQNITILGRETLDSHIRSNARKANKGISDLFN